MIANFGSKLVKFVQKQRKGLRAPGQGSGAGKIVRSLGMPFRPVIFADGQYAIFDDMAGFKVHFQHFHHQILQLYFLLSHC